LSVEVVVVRTSGDAIQQVPLSQAGGQGFFVKELETALAAGDIDLAVHSAKDLPGLLAPGMVLGAITSREDPRDCLVSHSGACLDELPAGATVATSAVRRQAMVAHQRPDLVRQELRGNIDTRLRKLAEGQFDAMIVARAALARLGRLDEASEALPVDRFLPAVAQGALAVEIREDDKELRQLVATVDDPTTAVEVRAERALLAALHGGCQLPLGALAEHRDGTLVLRACLLSPDGGQRVEAELPGSDDEPEALGAQLARLLKERGGAAILAQLRAEP
jgi:hydroxymethylbilane synthase